MCRELVKKAGDQRPGSIIVKIDRQELRRGQRKERPKMEDAHKTKQPEASCSGLGGTGSTGGNFFERADFYDESASGIYDLAMQDPSDATRS